MGNKKKIKEKLTMNSNLFLFCIALAFTCALCQNPKPCETPKLWEGIHHQYDHEKRELARGHIFYDATYKRHRFVEEFEEGQEKEALDVLSLHAEKLFTNTISKLKNVPSIRLLMNGEILVFQKMPNQLE